MPCIYLSPSTQEYNPYLSGGTEEYFTNLIADAIQPYLLSSNICFGRNMPWMTASQSADNANVFNYEAYLAIHSNAAPENLAGKIRGCDVYYYANSNNSKRFAQIIAENYKTIYPIPSKVNTIANTSLVELNKPKAPSALIEIGYHDNKEDEAWIKANIANIALVLARSLAEFTGTEFIMPPPFIKGKVTTSGTGLNIRQSPSSSSQVVARAPNNSTVNIYCKCGIWYRVSYNETFGYAAASYIIPGSRI